MPASLFNEIAYYDTKQLPNQTKMYAREVSVRGKPTSLFIRQESSNSYIVCHDSLTNIVHRANTLVEAEVLADQYIQHDLFVSIKPKLLTGVTSV